jgi:hypothetical protein
MAIPFYAIFTHDEVRQFSVQATKLDCEIRHFLILFPPVSNDVINTILENCIFTNLSYAIAVCMSVRYAFPSFPGIGAR